MSEQPYDLQAAYQNNRFFEFNMEFYDNVRAEKPNWKEAQRKLQPNNRGCFMYLKGGQVLRVNQPEGPIMTDLWLYNANAKDCYDERFDLHVTNIIDGFLLPKNSRIWTQEPYRPIATYIDDNIHPDDLPDVPMVGAVWPGGHCTPNVVEASHGIQCHSACWSTGWEGFMDAGFEPEVAIRMASQSNLAVHAVRSIGMNTTPAGNEVPIWISHPSRLRAGTYVDFFIEFDTLAVTSHCPYGDGAAPVETSVQHPLELIAFDTGIEPLEHPKYYEWQPEFLELYNLRKAAGDTGENMKPASKLIKEDLAKYRKG